MLLNDHKHFRDTDYAYALTATSIGNAREKFASVVGPRGTSPKDLSTKTGRRNFLKNWTEQIRNYVDGRSN
jgi:hypothetical protein